MLSALYKYKVSLILTPTIVASDEQSLNNEEIFLVINFKIIFLSQLMLPNIRFNDIFVLSVLL